MFKVLIINGKYVDVNRLHKGIYATDMPSLWRPDMTLVSVRQAIIDRYSYRTDIIAPLRKIHRNIDKLTLATFELKKVA